MEMKNGGAIQGIAGNEQRLRDFRSSTGAQNAIAKRHGATLEVHVGGTMPESIGSWLDSKGIAWYDGY